MLQHGGLKRKSGSAPARSYNFLFEAISVSYTSQPETATLEKANSENMPILVSSLPAFEVVGRLYKLGIKGIDDA